MRRTCPVLHHRDGGGPPVAGARCTIDRGSRRAALFYATSHSSILPHAARHPPPSWYNNSTISWSMRGAIIRSACIAQPPPTFPHTSVRSSAAKQRTRPTTTTHVDDVTKHYLPPRHVTSVYWSNC